MERFYTVQKDDISFYMEASKSKNTNKSTKNWLSVYSSWASSRGFNPQIESYSPIELNKVLEIFYIEIRKADGGNYEPSCLKVMISGLDR